MSIDNKIKVLYEDNHIIAVQKPVGVLTQGDSTGKESLMDMVKEYLKEKYHKPGNVFLGLVHRLDKPVSGIVLFAKTSKGASRLSEQFRNRTIEKTYHAVVVGKPKEDGGVMKSNINKISFFAEGFSDKTDQELLAEIKKATKTRSAELEYRVVKSNEKYSLLKVMPRTGRFHQIRVQMADLGCPILGDDKYGASRWEKKDEIALCATDISFKMATEDKIIDLHIPLPEEWSKYIK